ncbi:hypothetical protein [Pedobacter steynii]
MKNISKASLFIAGCSIIAGIASCGNPQDKNTKTTEKTTANDSLQKYVNERLDIYEKVKLTTNLNDLTINERKILPLLIQSAQIMDDLFWKQAYPQRDSLLNTIKDEKQSLLSGLTMAPGTDLMEISPLYRVLALSQMPPVFILQE